jgi:hypothetical protein
MDISKIIGDKPKQEEGAWIKLNEEVSFLVVYSDSRKPRNFFVSGFSKLRQKSRGKVPPIDKQQELTLDMLVKHVVKGWRGLEQKDPNDPDGKKMIPFDYSEENCRKLLEDSTAIRDFISAEAADIENFGGSLDGEGEEDQEGGPSGEMKSRSAVES